MTDFQDYDVFVFDCDGVILDSNSLKSNAFREALQGEPQELIDQLVEYHKSNGGISRYKKFNHFYKTIYPSKQIKKKSNQALTRFGDIVSKGLLEVAYVEGVIEFIKTHSPSKHLYVDSGSDQIELRKVFIKRSINDYFIKIFGSPNTKEENLEKIYRKHGEDKKYLFFGDSKSDYLAAKAFGIDFVFISGYSEWKNPQGEFSYIGRDFTDLILL